jgi:RNA polymerase subunit RPABC4/transcription elongation factor Spt4
MNMRYCYECGRVTGGQPRYCQFCGRTYDVKLCPRRHENPRYAEVCSQCGSRELSTPQPKVPVVWKIAQFFVQVLVGFFVVYVVLSFIYGMLSSFQTNNALLALILLLVALMVVWSIVPDCFKRLVRRSLGKGGHREDR